MPKATEADYKDFEEIMNDDKTARDYWSFHCMKLCELNSINTRFTQAIDALCNEKQMVDPIEIKKVLKETQEEKSKLRKTVEFGRKALSI
jgi:hypothetical protein